MATTAAPLSRSAGRTGGGGTTATRGARRGTAEAAAKEGHELFRIFRLAGRAAYLPLLPEGKKEFLKYMATMLTFKFIDGHKSPSDKEFFNILSPRREKVKEAKKA